MRGVAVPHSEKEIETKKDRINTGKEKMTKSFKKKGGRTTGPHP